MRAAAFAAGLGEYGWSKVFLTPEFDPMQRFVALLTDLEVEPDPIFEGKICDRCMSCARMCAWQTFHDNLIAHQVPGGDYGLEMGYPAPCHQYLNSLPGMEGITEFMRVNWVRPEEIHLYEPYFDEVKLATRMHARPRMVVAAYCRGKFKGNLLDLTEPSYSRLFRGYIIDNTRIPAQWFPLASGCGKQCENCHVCENALKSALMKYTD